MVRTVKIFVVFAIIATLVFCAWVTVRTVKVVQFNLNCTQYIKRAANASTVELAKEELSKAISYAESHNLTEGIVSVFLHQPINDVGYWYQNMTKAYNELENLPENATSLEKTNVLMKLRESLTNTEVPAGISIYPNNVPYFWWGLISFIFMFGLWVAESLLSCFGTSTKETNLSLPPL